MLLHGEVGSGNWSHSRWCAIHRQYHGILFNCETYPAKLRSKIDQEYFEFMNNIKRYPNVDDI